MLLAQAFCWASHAVSCNLAISFGETEVRQITVFPHDEFISRSEIKTQVL